MINDYTDLSVAEKIEYDEYELAVAQQQFEQREWGVRCAVCKKEERKTQQALEADGWLLTPGGEFCQAHNFRRQLLRNRLNVTSPII